MTFAKLLAEGFSAARRHPRLVLVAYLVPLVPALLLAAMARSTIAPVFDYSLLARSVLDGSWNGVWSDFAASPANHMSVVLGSGVMLALLLTALLRVPVAAGIAEVLIEGEAAQPHPFLAGVAQHTWRFLRSAAWFAVAGALTAGVVGGTVAVFFSLAEKRSDARLDLAGFAAGALLALLVLAIFKPAYDLARLAAARHDDRKTLRGYFRAIWAVLRHPGIFLPLFASFVLLIAALHLGYYAVRSPWTPATAAAIAALLVAQQLVMAVRAVFSIASWGAELAAYRALGEPRFCEKRQRRLLVIDEPVRAVATAGSIEAPLPGAAPEPGVETTPEPVAESLPEPVADPFPEPAPAPAEDVFTPTATS